VRSSLTDRRDKEYQVEEVMLSVQWNVMYSKSIMTSIDYETSAARVSRLLDLICGAVRNREASYHHVLVHAHDTSVDRHEGYESPGPVNVSSVEDVVAIGSLRLSRRASNVHLIHA
jgi:hypothetical protein